MQALTDAQVVNLRERAAAGDDKALAVEQAVREVATAFVDARAALEAAYADALPALRALVAALRALQAAAESAEVGEDR